MAAAGTGAAEPAFAMAIADDCLVGLGEAEVGDALDGMMVPAAFSWGFLSGWADGESLVSIIC